MNDTQAQRRHMGTSEQQGETTMAYKRFTVMRRHAGGWMIVDIFHGSVTHVFETVSEARAKAKELNAAA